MPYQQPLVPPVIHVADPVDLPLRAVGENGLCQVIAAKVLRRRRDGFELTVSASTGGTLFAEVVAAGDGVIRVRLAPGQDTRGRSAPVATLVRPGTCDEALIEEFDGGLRLSAGELVAEIVLDPWQLRFFDSTGRLLTEQNGVETDISERLRILPFGRSAVAGEIVAYHETFSAQPDEHFFGLGEKFTEFDKRGQRIISWNYDAFSAESERAYKNVPFYLSTRGYGVLVDSGMATEFDLCHSTHSCVQITVPDDQLDYYLIAGEDPGRIIDRYHALTGRPEVPPKWALGTWISTGYAAKETHSGGLVDSQEQVIQVARRIRERGIPCDVIHVDTQWQRYDHWSDFQWDTGRFPDPDAMLKELAELDFQVCLWINPYISHLSPVFREADALGILMRHEDGSTFVADSWHGAQPACGIIDLTNPAAVGWFQGILRALLRQGVSSFKTDFGEGVPVDAHAANGMSGKELHNVYSLIFNDVVAEVTQEVHGHRVVWARSSFTGGQRHCGQWSGDTNATFSSMASTLRGGLSYALSGVPFWTHDAGGFTGTPSAELYVRSAQFAALSPLTRFHGTSSRLPWDFGPVAEQAVKEALELRYRLMPYLYSAAVEAGRSGQPMMRPLLMAAFGEPAAWAADLEYLLGPDLLVAPVVSAVDPARHVYLPPGRWADFWTGAVHDGGRHVEVAKPLAQIPLFVRLASVIPMAEGGLTGPAFVQWGDGVASTRLRDEHGETTVEVQRRDGTVVVRSDGPVRVDRLAFPLVAGAAEPTDVVVDGERFSVTAVAGTATAVREAR
ncbi:TIM-barrel domain-containing protein [Amycolatopsis tolypomycina]|uniref:Alpha-D-xyloside xylohydrolase n=1 Tax=Amycolatopsis tolypomycina TaxID=208445 RepID=A0A1H4YUH3_9PSEU|nr:TIM-barrel domain-containing protein [Amycolatopsis tolypomycina]SED21632.1 alpha-D-xyloside xylohydrolase [Amycolatopsis tolypomycina]